MNSTIQCLAQSPYLTHYFLNGDFVHHINKNNPLGWKGKVAQAWAQLLKDMFSNEYKVLAPRDFKAAIGEVAPRCVYVCVFLGYSQQDSQELLSFLLDGLHEDLNQIQQKPGTESVESNGRPDEVVAAEAWRTYLKRNVSIIVDLLQGQYKSRVECPDCGRVSITFDPYMFLSAPLPTERYKVFEFTWIGNDPNALPTVYGVK
ncbi:ubiquitin specific peptidase 4, partial [Reticulomyxa filosa]